MKRRGAPEGPNPLISTIVPIVIAVLVIVLIGNYLFSKGTTTQTTTTGDFVTIAPKEDKSEIYVYLGKGEPFLINGEKKMFTTDQKMEVRQGEAQIRLEGDTSSILVDHLGEISYGGLVNGRNVIGIDNGYIWVESQDNALEFHLKNFVAISDPHSVIVVNQNTIASNLYVLRGSATAQVNGMIATVGVGQKITILKSDLTNLSKLADKLEPIDDFFKTTDWFLKNKGADVLASSGSGSVSLSGTTASGSTGAIRTVSGTLVPTTNGRYVTLSNPGDEATVNDTKTDLVGDILSSDVTKVTVNDREALLNVANRTFTYKGFPITSGANNIVYKAFGASGNLLQKGVSTVYGSKKDTKESDANKKPTVTTYPISDKDFRIVSPASNPYKTIENVVKIEGRSILEPSIISPSTTIACRASPSLAPGTIVLIRTRGISRTVSISIPSGTTVRMGPSSRPTSSPS